MIKKTISFSFVIILIFLVYQFLVTMVKDNHHVTYSISKDDVFNIDEKYVKNSKQDYYLIKVNSNDNNYVFKIENTFNKQKNIVEDVEIIEQDGYYCLGLNLVGKDKYSYPECIKDGITYSYSSVKDTIDLYDYVSKIKDNNYDKYSSESIKENELGLIINRDYIDNNEIIMVYAYKQIDLLYANYSRSFSFSSLDNYKNLYGTLVGNYYIIPKITSLPTFDIYIKYDVIDGIRREIELPKSITKQSYINGVDNDKLYIFDKSNKEQIEIDPKEDSVKVVGDVDQEGITFVNGKKQPISVYDLEKEEVLFEEKKDNYSFDDGEYIASNSYYAIFKKDDDYYKVYKDYQDTPILLFSDADVKDIKVRDDNVYFMKDNGIYKCNLYGIFGLVYRNEFIYNNDNIYDVYLK